MRKGKRTREIKKKLQQSNKKTAKNLNNKNNPNKKIPIQSIFEPLVPGGPILVYPALHRSHLLFFPHQEYELQLFLTPKNR